MGRFIILIVLFVLCIVQSDGEAETVLSSVLTPINNLVRQQRSYYERYGYGYGRPYDRLDDRPSRCGRCDDDDDDDDDYDRGRDRDDDKWSNSPSSSRNDRNKNYNDDDKRYDDDRNKNKNGTDDQNDDRKRPHDGDRRNNKRKKHRNRYDDRDKYRPDYYDRFLRDPQRDRDGYDDPYLRRPYDRYPNRYNEYGRYDDYGYSGYRRPHYDDGYGRGFSGTAYDPYGGYGPGVGRGPHDSFRPWDETYRGQAGWDTSGRGYYFASGRPDAASAWSPREYSRPQTSGGLQNAGYGGYTGYSAYNNPGYRVSSGYEYQDTSGYGGNGGYGQSSGWRNVGERRPYRDQSGVANLDRKPQDNTYGQNQGGYSQRTYQPGTYTQSSTVPSTSYLFQREDDIVTQETTLPPS